MDRHIVIKEFQSMVSEVSKGINPLAVFRKLQQYNLSKVELMIIDSAIKGMPLENLYETLILSADGYNTILQNLTFKLVEVYQAEAKEQYIRTST